MTKLTDSDDGDLAPKPTDQTLDFSIDDGKSKFAVRGSIESLPIEIPTEFCLDQCVASRPGQWLLRGHDAVRRTPLAMKVMQLPTLLTDEQANHILDGCELSAKVKHPAWISAHSAAVRHRHLSVIRPWLFATAWNEFVSEASQDAQLQALATVAYAAASGHETLATHGGLHAGNLLVGHDGDVHIVDGGYATNGIAREIAENILSRNPVDSTFEQRRDNDIRDFIKLVATTEAAWDYGAHDDLVGKFKKLFRSESSGAIARFGDELMAKVDGRVVGNTPMRSFWYSWPIAKLPERLGRLWRRE